MKNVLESLDTYNELSKKHDDWRDEREMTFPPLFSVHFESEILDYRKRTFWADREEISLFFA